MIRDKDFFDNPSSDVSNSDNDDMDGEDKNES